MTRGNHGFSFNLDLLTDIILLYANTPPQIERLNDIEEALTDEKYVAAEYREGCLPPAGGYSKTCLPPVEYRKVYFPPYDWEYAGLSRGVLDARIRLIIGIGNVGQQAAFEIFFDTPKKNAFIENVLEHKEPYPPNMELLRSRFDSAFYELYGYTVKLGGCPCSFVKMDVLSEKGFVTKSESLGRTKWNRPRLTCLECDHIQFVTALDALQEDGCRYLSEIVARYSRRSLEEACFTGDKRRPIGKQTYRFGYEENEAAFPRYLDGLPCNLLIDYLAANDGNVNKIKRCTYCMNFFISKTTKESKFCSDKCRLNFHNKANIQSGKAAAYKKEGREKGRYQ